jgi:hypothetical protein
LRKKYNKNVDQPLLCYWPADCRPLSWSRRNSAWLWLTVLYTGIQEFWLIKTSHRIWHVPAPASGKFSNNPWPSDRLLPYVPKNSLFEFSWSGPPPSPSRESRHTFLWNDIEIQHRHLKTVFKAVSRQQSCWRLLGI